MSRTVTVRGKPGVLVQHPHALEANPRRCLGQKYVPVAAGKAPDPDVTKRYVPTIEQVVDHPLVRKALRRGEVELVAADDPSLAAMVPAPAAAPPAGSTETSSAGETPATETTETAPDAPTETSSAGDEPEGDSQ
jgi:hypothetical protein